MKQTKSGMSTGTWYLVNGTFVEMVIAAENEVLLQVEGILQAVESLMCMYYVSNIQYPKECLNTFIFLQRNILKAYTYLF